MTSKRNVKYWVIPPKSDAAFVAAMEQTIETYQRPYDPETPVVCMDEQPVTLRADIAGRESIRETATHRINASITNTFAKGRRLSLCLSNR